MQLFDQGACLVSTELRILIELENLVVSFVVHSGLSKFRYTVSLLKIKKKKYKHAECCILRSQLPFSRYPLNRIVLAVSLEQTHNLDCHRFLLNFHKI